MLGVTPGQAVPDMSPVKVEDEDRHRRANGRAPLDSEPDRHVMSSSPPPMDAMGSPSKPARGSQVPFTSSSARKDRDTETRSRSASAAVSLPGHLGGSAGTTPVLQQANFNSTVQAQPTNGAQDDDDDDLEGGFDLAKGFAPIARGLGAGISRRVGV